MDIKTTALWSAFTCVVVTLAGQSVHAQTPAKKTNPAVETFSKEDELVLRQAHDFEAMVNLWNAGKFAEIDAIYARAIPLEEKRSGQSSSMVAHLLTNRGDYALKRGKAASYEPLFKRAILILSKSPEQNLDDQKTCLSGLGYAAEEHGRLAEAESYFKRAMIVEEKSAGADTNEELLAMAIDDLAQVYFKEGKYNEARSLYKRSLTMREATYGKQSDMVQNCLERLAEVDKKLGKKKDNLTASERILAIREQKFGPVLGPFFRQMHNFMSHKKDHCILPLTEELATGKMFDEAKATAILKQRLGPPAPEWSKVPDWMAGLWGSRDVPKNLKVKEVDGVLWDDPPPRGFYEGPGPYARRRGAVQTKGGWWDYAGPQSKDFWSTLSREGSSQEEYTYTHRHPIVTTGDGSVIMRTSNIFFAVNVVGKRSSGVLLGKGKINSVWQEDQEEIFHLLPDKKVCLYAGTRIYGWNGEQLTKAPGDPDRVAYDGVAIQNKISGPKAFNYPEMNSKASLISYLKKHGMIDEVARVQAIKP